MKISLILLTAIILTVSVILILNNKSIEFAKLDLPAKADMSNINTKGLNTLTGIAY